MLEAPPIADDANLQAFDWTPLNRRRLFASAFHAAANDSEWRAGVTLWLKSWDQVPAGSLPDDDAALCRLAELGTDVKRWKKLRDKAMRGWTKHADGRLYHNVVTETVLEALGQKEAARIRREQVAERNRQWRERRDKIIARRKCDASRDASRDASCDDHEGVSSPSSNLYDRDRTGTGPRSRENTSAAAPPPPGGTTGAGETTPPPATPAAPGLSQVLNGIDKGAIQRAVADGDLRAVLVAFKANTSDDRMPDWERDTDTLRMATVVAILAWRRDNKRPVREPSGFRSARESWNALSRGERHEIGHGLLVRYGLEQPPPTQEPEQPEEPAA